MKNCKTCLFWEAKKQGATGICDLVDSNQPPQTRFEVVVSVADDHDLSVRLFTGPDFGCILHEERSEA